MIFINMDNQKLGLPLDMGLIRKNLAIKQICKFDDWMNQLVRMKSFQVIEKMEHLIGEIHLQVLDEQNFKILLNQIEEWYYENGEREAMTDYN